MRHSVKNGYFLHYLLLHATAALCVNTLLAWQQLFPLFALRHIIYALCVGGASGDPGF